MDEITLNVLAVDTGTVARGIPRMEQVALRCGCSLSVASIPDISFSRCASNFLTNLVFCFFFRNRMMGSDGKAMKEAGTAQPVRVIGFKGQFFCCC